MSDDATQAMRYCSDLVRTRDEDRWLAVQYARGGGARRLIALYAFHCELRRIPAAVTEPAMGEIRLQWRRDALARLRAGKTHADHPVHEELAAAGLAGDAFADGLEALIDAAARPLYGEGFTDLSDLARWLRRAEGTVDALAVRILAGDTALAQHARKAGAVFAMAREGAMLAPNLAGEIAERGPTLWREAAANLNSAPPRVAPAILHLTLTRAYLERSRRPFPLHKRLSLFATMATGRF